ncbi:MAG: hypothetical protein J07HX64_03021 [halophilic archaeon J07HX64]|nr:MAG: hypothetical protein J07HX64_03021 [halophilic archaeon J07HX64]
MSDDPNGQHANRYPVASVVSVGLAHTVCSADGHICAPQHRLGATLVTGSDTGVAVTGFLETAPWQPLRA